MFGEHPYYNETIKKSIVAFGNLFSDIYIRNFDPTSGDLTRSLKCPISYAAKQQWFTRLKEDPDFQAKFETDIPRLSFEVVDYQYNPAKKFGNGNNMILQNCGIPKAIYAPVPYRLSLELSSYTKNQEDSLQILEQVLPFFQPALNLSIIVLPEFSIKLDIPVIFNGVKKDDNYKDLMNNRIILQTLSFFMDIQLFGPSDSQVGVIKETIIDVNTKSASITATPDTTYDAVVNPRSAEKNGVYTIDEMWSGQP